MINWNIYLYWSICCPSFFNTNENKCPERQSKNYYYQKEYLIWDKQYKVYYLLVKKKK